MKSISYKVGKGRYEVSCRVFFTEEGLIVHLMGGEKHHIGAIAVGVPRPSLRGEGISATTSVMTLTGHKDDELARPAANKMATFCKTTVVVVAGVHVDNAQPQDLIKLQNNAEKAVEGALKIIEEKHII